MKRITISLAAALLIFTGCQKPEDNQKTDADAPVLELTGSQINVSPWAGTDTISYTITNPAEGGKISAVSAETWIDNFNYDTPNKISFSYQANEGEARSSIVTVTYEYGEGERTEKLINIVQEPSLFNITVDDIKPTSARIISTCYSESTCWTSDVISREELETQIGGKEALPDYLHNFMTETMWIQYGYDNFDEFIRYYLFQPNTTDDWVYTELGQNTEYLTYAVGMDYEGNYTTEFYWGPEFTTSEVAINENLTFDIDVDAKAVIASFNVTPSDATVPYLVSNINADYYDSNADAEADEEIMSEICNNYGEFISNYAYLGTQTVSVSNIEPGTRYYAIAFGVDIEAYTFNSRLTKVEYTTKGNEDAGPYASATINHWWDIDDLVAYNPEYENYRSQYPLLVAIEFELNSEAESAKWIIWYGDVTTEKYEDVYQMTLNAEPAEYIKGEPAPINYMPYDKTSTLCVIAVDADGNLGDMYMQSFTLTTAGKSNDFGLFDNFFNDLMGGNASISNAPYRL